MARGPRVRAERQHITEQWQWWASICRHRFLFSIWSASATCGVCIARVVGWTISSVQFSCYRGVPLRPGLVFHRSKLSVEVEDEEAVVKSWQTLKCSITDTRAVSVALLLKKVCLNMPYFSSSPRTDVHHFLYWNWWNSRISARGWVTLVSFVCQQACLFFSGGVRFSGLLNQTGRFVPGSQPDARTGGGSRH